MKVKACRYCGGVLFEGACVVNCRARREAMRSMAERAAKRPRGGDCDPPLCSFCYGDGFNADTEICASCNGTGKEPL